MADGWGGKREGAGRKKGFAALAAERIREKVAKEIEDNYEKYWKPQLEKAEKGDTNAFREIREFAFGKPRQNLGLDGGEDGTPVSVVELTDEQYNRLVLEESRRIDSEENRTEESH